ncbi:hypothetical protein E1212_10760 [Jiangella ureilytica]|uniref:Uncharacterized protein n=1 Tax=Jiangella ureilytica TaxID=2530374 RepID=A0A4R4RPS4_9ACTN|nr:hypothetical protein [Jiangella ureilytica]TDC51881.1 hypothetical protein E1212_10760 [Jiangella ureilytica]
MSGSGGVRRAIETLLRAHADVSRSLGGASSAAAVRVTRVAEVAREARHPVTRAVADDVEAAAPAVERAMAELTAETGRVLATEVHALLDLLAVSHHGQESLPPLDLGRLGGPGSLSAEAFPSGFARSYVATVLGDLSRGAATSKAEAAAHPAADQASIDAARERIIAVVAPEHRARVRAWLEHPDCHAVEIHGPQVGDRELELRAGWTRPPDHGTEGADTWQVRKDDHKVVSKHRAGPDASAFTSAEAFARPLEAFLGVAARHPHGVDGFLDECADLGWAAFFIKADQGGLQPGDTTARRGAGTGTPPAATDWIRMRNDAMKKDGECPPPVRTISYDPIAEHPDSGVRLVFRHGDDGWVMVTYYPSDSPAPDNQPLEELT